MGEELAVLAGSQEGLRRGCELVFTSVKFRLGIFREIWSDTPQVTLILSPLWEAVYKSRANVYLIFSHHAGRTRQ